MKVIYIAVLAGVVIFAAAMAFAQKEDGDTVVSDGAAAVTESGKGAKEMNYTSISMMEAKQIFEKDGKGGYIILDVRRPDEFARGHIPRAINIANETIGADQPKALPDKEQVIYVYCRSGNRSKQAAGKLAAMGYSNIIEFGGIMDWDGEIEKF